MTPMTARDQMRLLRRTLSEYAAQAKDNAESARFDGFTGVVGRFEAQAAAYQLAANLVDTVARARVQEEI